MENIEFNALLVYDDHYIQARKETYGDKFSNNFRALNVLEDDIEYKSFTVNSIDYLLVYSSNYYIRVYFDISTCRIFNQKTDRLFWWKCFWRLDIIKFVLL